MTPERLLRFDGAVRRDPAVEAWFDARPDELGAIARRWFELMRDCGDEVRELVHDGCPAVCVGDAGFGYVNVFRSHVNVGFFRGARLRDPSRMLEGTGKLGRHVKLRPGAQVDEDALIALIEGAYAEVRSRIEEGAG